jgi:preprotein translocase subunit SecE
VARPTRSQRRARRQAQAEQQQAAVAPRTRSRQQVRAAAAQEPRREQRERRAPGGGFAGFVSESWAELKKVEWPGQRQVMTGTVVVIIACGIVGGYLWLADLVLKRVVQNVLLGQ